MGEELTLGKDKAFRLLSNALSLGRFTAAELATRAGIGVTTASSWVDQHEAWFETSSDRGRAPLGIEPGAPKEYRLRPTATRAVQAALEETFRAVAPAVVSNPDNPPAEFSGLGDPFAALSAAERRFEELEAAERAGNVALVGSICRSLRVLVKLAWRDLDDLAAAGADVPMPKLEILARVARRADPAAVALTRSSLNAARYDGRELPETYIAKVLLARAMVSGRGSVDLLVAQARRDTVDKRETLLNIIADVLRSGRASLPNKRVLRRALTVLSS